MRNRGSNEPAYESRLAGMRVSPDARRANAGAQRVCAGRCGIWALVMRGLMGSVMSVVAACGSTDGPLLRALSAGDAAAGDALAQAGAEPSPSGDSMLIRPGMRLHYQLTGEPSVDAAAQVFVIDLFDAEPAQVATLRAGAAAGRIAIAYLSAGSFEPWRPDIAQFPDSVVGTRLGAYPDEKWLDVRAQAVRDVMQARLRLARDKGFDGVLPGALGAYRSDSGFPLTQADQLDYDRFLSSEARALGLSPGLSGDFLLARELAGAFDWAIAFGCLAADSCGALQPLVEQHKAVFNLEVDGDLNELCARAEPLGITTILKRPTFDAWSRSCP